MKRLLAACVLALALAAPAHAGGPKLIVGAAEDVVKQPTLPETKAQVDLAKLAGFGALRVTQVWAPGQMKPSAADSTALQNVRTATELDGMRLFVTVMNFGSRTTPLTDDDRADFAAFAANVATVVRPDYVIVGNEPNLNRFWLPQFNVDGTDAAAPAYEALLAQTYDAVKQAAPRVLVLGPALSPRGGDDPSSSRPTHSPTVFTRDLGAAYRASGRTAPLLDGFVIHPYEDNSDVEPVQGLHPNSTTISIGDYDKLVVLVDAAFGPHTPIYYGEFGVESTIATAKTSLYSGAEPTTIHPVDPVTQGRYYREAIQLAFCQPDVRALMLLHTRDEPGLPQWQSGVYYVDGTPKPSLPLVRAAIGQAHRGVVARCPALKLTPRGRAVAVPSLPAAMKLTCDIDCVYSARAGRRTAHGRAVGGVATTVRFRQLPPGTYRVRFTLAAPLNPGPPGHLTATLSASG